MAENYKHLYEQMKKMVEKYQDEVVPGLRKKIEELENSRVEVVRCKDCKHWHEGTGRCDQHSHYEQDELNEFDRDYFCSYGERKVE